MSSAAHVTSMSLPQRLARSASLVRTRVAPTQYPSSTNPGENEGGSHTADVNEMRISNGSRAKPTHIFPLLPPTRYRAPLRTVTHVEPSR